MFLIWINIFSFFFFFFFFSSAAVQFTLEACSYISGLQFTLEACSYVSGIQFTLEAGSYITGIQFTLEACSYVSGIQFTLEACSYNWRSPQFSTFSGAQCLVIFSRAGKEGLEWWQRWISLSLFSANSAHCTTAPLHQCTPSPLK